MFPMLPENRSNTRSLRAKNPRFEHLWTDGNASTSEKKICMHKWKRFYEKKHWLEKNQRDTNRKTLAILKECGTVTSYTTIGKEIRGEAVSRIDGADGRL